MLFILKASLDKLYVYDTKDHTSEWVTYQQIDEINDKDIKIIPVMNDRLKSLIRQYTYSLKVDAMRICNVTSIGKISVVIGSSMQNHWTYIYDKNKQIFASDNTCDVVIFHLGDIDLLSISYGVTVSGTEIYSLLEINKKTGRHKDIYKFMRPKLYEIHEEQFSTRSRWHKKQEWWYTARNYYEDDKTSVVNVINNLTGTQYILGDKNKVIKTDKNERVILNPESLSMNISTFKVLFPTYNIDFDKQLQEIVSYLTQKGSIENIYPDIETDTSNTYSLNLYSIWHRQAPRVTNFLVCDILSAYLTYKNLSKLQELSTKCNLCECIVFLTPYFQWSLGVNDLNKLYSYYINSGGTYNVISRFDSISGTGHKNLDLAVEW